VKLTETIYAAIEARGYTAGLTSEQFAVRQVVKALEELGEAFGLVSLPLDHQEQDWREAVRDAAAYARHVFDGQDRFRSATIRDRQKLISELADVVIPALCAIHALGGSDNDILSKAQADIARGVRSDLAGLASRDQPGRAE